MIYGKVKTTPSHVELTSTVESSKSSNETPRGALINLITGVTVGGCIFILLSVVVVVIVLKTWTNKKEKD